MDMQHSSHIETTDYLTGENGEAIDTDAKNGIDTEIKVLAREDKDIHEAKWSITQLKYQVWRLGCCREREVTMCGLHCTVFQVCMD